jgi:Na+/serine symporter
VIIQIIAHLQDADEEMMADLSTLVKIIISHMVVSVPILVTTLVASRLSGRSSTELVSGPRITVVIIGHYVRVRLIVAVHSIMITNGRTRINRKVWI